MKTIQMNENEIPALLILSYAYSALPARKPGTIRLWLQEQAGTSSVNIYLTDDPSLVFDHVFLDISRVEIKVEDDSESAVMKVNITVKWMITTTMGKLPVAGWLFRFIPVYMISCNSAMDWIHYLQLLVLMQAVTLRKVRITLGSNSHVVA